MGTTKLSIIRDINGLISYTLPQSNVIYTGLLTINVAQTITAPTDALAYVVRLGSAAGADIFISIGGSATIPTGSPTLSTTEVNIAQFYVDAGETISIISSEDKISYSMGFYAIS
jgi:hypothetical protein